jgi:putative ABC transport system permease protein
VVAKLLRYLFGTALAAEFMDGRGDDIPHLTSVQFLAEAILLSLADAIAAIAVGAVATGVYAHVKDWATVIPHWPGQADSPITAHRRRRRAHPALRAARMPSIQALWSQ